MTANIPKKKAADCIHFAQKGSEVQINRFFHHVYDNFRFYRQRFLDSGVKPSDEPLDVMDLLPVMTPEEYGLLERDVVSHVRNRRFFTDLTTGTTGHQKTRYTTLRDEKSEAMLCERFFRSCGMCVNDRVLALDIDSAEIYLFYGQVLRSMGVRDFLFGTVPSDSLIEVERMLRTDPTTLIVVPSLLSRIVRLISSELSRGGLQELRKLIYIGEAMPSWLRRFLEQRMSLEVFSFFGSTEIGSVAGECRAHEGIHIYNDCVVPSVLSPVKSNGCVCGEVAWTTLHFEDHPLLKYSTLDHVMLSNTKCKCGVHGPRIHVVSRLQDQFSIYGHKFCYDAFMDALDRADVNADYLQIEVKEIDCKTHIVFYLPSCLKCHEESVHEALTGADDVGYFKELGFVTEEIKFIDSPVCNGRKVRRVIDRRH